MLLFDVLALIDERHLARERRRLDRAGVLRLFEIVQTNLKRDRHRFDLIADRHLAVLVESQPGLIAGSAVRAKKSRLNRPVAGDELQAEAVVAFLAALERPLLNSARQEASGTNF